MPSRWILACMLVLGAAASAQTAAPARSASLAPCGSPSECAAVAKNIAGQFGPEFEPLPAFPPLVGDMDADGIEDAVLVATGSPLGGQEEFGYKVVDPYNAYFGWGDPKVTATFEQMYPGPRKHVLVVHSWKAEKPKAKFVIINLPFEKLSLTRASLKKKPMSAIAAIESSSLSSVTFWDGKRYRWRADSIAE